MNNVYICLVYGEFIKTIIMYWCLTRQEVQFVTVAVSLNSQPIEGAGLPWATHTRKTVELTSTVSLHVEITIVTLVDSARVHSIISDIPLQ